jgi:sporulation protein YlmC with PRC-barrel domain
MAKQQRTDTRETTDLIASDKVEGTEVYRSNGDHVGEIERVMIEKRSGKVAYAVMSFGGFLGMGEDYYPLPWSLLTTMRDSAATRSTSQSSSLGERRSSPTTRSGIGVTASVAVAFTTTTAQHRTGCKRL